jgi:arylsulfatase A-like enzyme
MPVNRRRFLKSLGASAALAPSLTGLQQRPPNVLFVLTDEWRAQATRYNGDTNVQTPVLDRLASQSVSFDCAVSGNPVCCPYRASLMTGQYPLTNGVFINDVELRPTGTTLAQAFAKAGYRTGFIGKWHLYGSPDGNYGRRLAPVPPDKRLGFEYWKAAECSHEYQHSLYYEGNDTTPHYWRGYDAFSQTEDACGLIDRQSKGADPWFLMLSLGPPHFPYETAPERYQVLYRDRELQLRPNVPPGKRAEAAKILRGYYAHMAALDECLDRLLKQLESSGVVDDTLVVFTSDHGDMMQSQGLTTKLYPWDESIRVPLLMRYPRRLSKGAHLRTPINSPDLMPTLLRTCGLPVPDGVEGLDYSGVFTGGRMPPANTAALLNLPVPITEARRYGFAEYWGLRTQRYTYVRSIHGPWLLYDNRRDPYQMHNLCNRTEARRVQRDLDKQLDARLHAGHDEFLPAAEYIRRANVGHYREVTMAAGHSASPWGDWTSTLR